MIKLRDFLALFNHAWSRLSKKFKTNLAREHLGGHTREREKVKT
jgi:hypothetical protein